jgi:hypothetical protein
VRTDLRDDVVSHGDHHRNGDRVRDVRNAVRCRTIRHDLPV